MVVPISRLAVVVPKAVSPIAAHPERWRLIESVQDGRSPPDVLRRMSDATVDRVMRSRKGPVDLKTEIARTKAPGAVVPLLDWFVRARARGHAVELGSPERLAWALQPTRENLEALGRVAEAFGAGFDSSIQLYGKPAWLIRGPKDPPVRGPLGIESEHHGRWEALTTPHAKMDGVTDAYLRLLYRLPEIGPSGRPIQPNTHPAVFLGDVLHENFSTATRDQKLVGLTVASRVFELYPRRLRDPLVLKKSQEGFDRAFFEALKLEDSDVEVAVVRRLAEALDLSHDEVVVGGKPLSTILSSRTVHDPVTWPGEDFARTRGNGLSREVNQRIEDRARVSGGGGGYDNNSLGGWLGWAVRVVSGTFVR